ncbi:MAG: hypothetical protein HZB32_06710 [Nitrospirae bacterium]|nr:hypothetical protein [Nitrospirota bacterium]
MKINKLQVKHQSLLVVFLIFFGILWGMHLPAASGEEEKAPEGIDLGQSFINAYESNDEAQMKSLVKENKNSVSKELVNMITYATSSEVKPEEMAYLVNVSGKMAGIYSIQFSDKRLENFVGNYKKWTPKEQDKRKNADRIYYSYKKDMKNKDYDAVVDKWDKSLEIYREIGDRLTEAKRLNEIGITFGKLGSFKTSIKYLDEARRINKEIGNTWGEINDLRFMAAGYVAIEDYSTATETYKSALTIVRELGDNTQRDILLDEIASTEKKMKDVKAKAE